jgi:hypothetical protein
LSKQQGDQRTSTRKVLFYQANLSSSKKSNSNSNSNNNNIITIINNTTIIIMKQQQFKISNPDTLANPWRGSAPALHTKAGFNDYVDKNLGDMAHRVQNIKNFMDKADVKEMLGEEFIKQFLQRDSKQWLQQRPLAIDFANSG